ncbi:MAG: SAM-dependent methyltransferase [Rickettsia endosymbiont of Bryobia graminum]|nr:SAM-dependent methyltransferase [Rickettsia endosymbiont of Bryobia graminum]
MCYKSIKEKIKLGCQRIKNFSSWYKAKIWQIINYFTDIKYKVNNIKETNFNLGLEHLKKNNLNDALLRFKIVEKFSKPEDNIINQVNYWCGWVYFLKSNYPKSLTYLKKSSKEDTVKLGSFLQNYQKLLEIPQPILCEYHNLTAKYYASRFQSDKIHLPYSFINKTISMITDLPDKYNILELGSNVGLVGYEVRKRFPDNFIFTGTESSQEMNKLLSLYYPNLNIYDQLLEVSIPEFLNEQSVKYDVILSYCSLSFTKDLINYFNLIYSITNNSGYFAFCLPINNSTKFSIERKQFVYTIVDIKAALNQTQFNILNEQELNLEKSGKYYMVVCQRNN